MTPDELQRTIEFIIEHQARTEVTLQRMEAAIEQQRIQDQQQRIQDQQHRTQDQLRLVRVEEAFVTLTELAEVQSRRIDLNERALEEFRGTSTAALNAVLSRIDNRFDEAFVRLDRIVELLIEKS